MIFEPPRYEWEATNVRQALEYLDAVKDMIDAHMASLAGGREGRWATERATPLNFTITLDLGPVIERINDKRTVDALAADLGDVDLGDLGTQ